MSSDLQLKAAEVNKTLSRNDGRPDKSLKVMEKDIQAMLAEMRKRHLAEQKSISEDELKYGHTQTNTPKHTCTVTFFLCDEHVVLMKVKVLTNHAQDQNSGATHCLTNTKDFSSFPPSHHACCSSYYPSVPLVLMRLKG